MTRGEINRLIREVGLWGNDTKIQENTLSKFESFASRIMDYENEACAKVVEEFVGLGIGFNAHDCARAIRKRAE
jgi:hypothetical protein